MEVVAPRSGQGWAELLGQPGANGGDPLPPGLVAQIDAAFDLLPPGQAVGITQDGTPSVLFTVQVIAPLEWAIHWASDGRTPLGTSLDVLDALVGNSPGVRWLAFCRRPALVRLLASRGWTLQGHEWEPFMALMVCQSGSDVAPEWGHEHAHHPERG